MSLIKSLDEIKKIKEANRIIAKLYRDILPPYIKPGITTIEIDKIADDYIRSCGAIPGCIGVPGMYIPFPCATCISVNNVVVHGIPSDRVLKNGDIVSVDTVTILDGYYGDAAITYPVGEISAEDQKLLEITERSRTLGIEQAKVGNRIGDIGHAVETFVEQHGFSAVKDFAGHGVGNEMHEDPIIPNYGRSGRGIKIENGMVLAIEPMINAGSYRIEILDDGWTTVTKDGRKSAHFEHSVAIVDGQPVILSIDD